ncbi:PAS sensor protein [Streptomyces sp. ICBB 8177]|nr:PAS sensor protein [Streptomyces sp. ICBB 8177]
MGATEPLRTGREGDDNPPPGRGRPPASGALASPEAPLLGTDAPGGLLDVLGVAAVVLDADGRIELWSPQAEDLFGYTAQEALGQFAGKIMVGEEHLQLAIGLFERVMGGSGSWAGVFPIRHKDGSTRFAEFRNMRLEDAGGRRYALGLAAAEVTVRQVETDLALSVRLVSQSPIGLAVLDTDLRYVTVNPALERINGKPAEAHVGRHVREVLSGLDVDSIEAAMRHVLATGTPLLDQYAVGRMDPEASGGDRAWSVSYYRLEDSTGRVLGLATSVIDVSERHRAATEAAQARQRLALIADASKRVGTTLDLDRTAHELADLCVPALADVAAVDVLDTVLGGQRTFAVNATEEGEATVFRALAVAAAHPTLAVRAADPPGEVAKYGPDRLVTRCAKTGRPVLVSQVTDADLRRIARDADAVALLEQAGVHSYLAVPLIARGEVLGALDLKRARNPLPFTSDDVALACELAARAAVCIDNARWYQSQRQAALTLQRHLLPHQPPDRPGLEIAYRYEPAQGPSQVGGDWFDVISLSGDRTALVVGDVMGSGIGAAATMGQVRTATRTLAELDLEPAAVLTHLDRITDGLERPIATCVYAVYDPRTMCCHIANAGHLPPVLARPGRPPELLELPTGAPLGVGGVPFESVELQLAPGDQLVLYTDGLVETRDQPLDDRLAELLRLLDRPRRPLQDTCDVLLHSLRHAADPDDVALLVSRMERLPQE